MESQYYRTFIALPFEVGPRFLQARQHIMTALKGERISWVDPGRYHVTLRFLGDLEISAIEEIGSALQERVTIPDRILLQLSGLGSFGPRKKPRVIWVGFEETGFFELLKDEVDLIVEQCGIPTTEQLFRAHLTLGRVRSLSDLNSYYKLIGEMSQQFNDSVLFKKLVFFRSKLGPQGPEYRVLNELLFL